MDCSSSNLLRVSLGALVRPLSVFSEEKSKATLKKALVLHLIAPFLLVLFNYHEALDVKLSWFGLLGVGFFFIVLLLAVFLHLLGVAIMHGMSKILEGKGRFVELLWLTGLYSIQLVLVVKAIQLLSGLSGWFSLLYIPFYAYALFLDFWAIRVSHKLSRNRSIVASISTLIVKAVFYAAIILAVYLIVGMLAVVGFLGANYYYGSETAIDKTGNVTVYTNIQEGYSITVPEGWNADENNTLGYMGYRMFTKDDAGFIMLNEGGVLNKILSWQSQNTTPEACDFMNLKQAGPQQQGISATGYRDYGNARGCEMRGLSKDNGFGQVVFTGTCCEKTPLMVTLQVLNVSTRPVNQTLAEYEALMESITCLQNRSKAE
jgi:hypothetical protein